MCQKTFLSKRVLCVKASLFVKVFACIMFVCNSEYNMFSCVSTVVCKACLYEWACLYVKVSVSILLPVSPSFHLSFFPSISSNVITYFSRHVCTMSLYFRHPRIFLYLCFMLSDLHTYTSHYTPLHPSSRFCTYSACVALGLRCFSAWELLHGWIDCLGGVGAPPCIQLRHSW